MTDDPQKQPLPPLFSRRGIGLGFHRIENSPTILAFYIFVPGLVRSLPILFPSPGHSFALEKPNCPTVPSLVVS